MNPNPAFRSPSPPAFAPASPPPKFAPSPASAFAPGPAPAFAPGPAPSSPDVGLVKSGALALVLTVLVYLGIAQPFRHTPVGQLLADRGWVPYLVTQLSIWALVMVAAKQALLRAQNKAFGQTLLPTQGGPTITTQRALQLIAGLDALAPKLRRTVLVSRLRDGLQLYAQGAGASAVQACLRHRAEADVAAYDASHTMIRAFVWAIPILGFIGTVLGIGAAVAGFSGSVGSAVDLEVVKQSIGLVTRGLAVAFDTTFLALVLSVVVMLPSSAVNKGEEHLLARVDAYCSQHLVSRLVEGPGTGSAQALRHGVGQDLARQQAMAAHSASELATAVSSQATVQNDLCQATRDVAHAVEEAAQQTEELRTAMAELQNQVVHVRQRIDEYSSSHAALVRWNSFGALFGRLLGRS